MKTNWNLKNLFQNETELEDFIQILEKSIDSFSQMYYKNLKNLNFIEFKEAIKIYEQNLQNLSKIMTYAFLNYATDSSKGAFYAKLEQKCIKLHEKILFFELEFNKLPKKTQDEHISHLKKYSFYLTNLQKNKNYQLKEKEESILLKKSQTSSSAFSRLFDEHFAKLKFTLDKKYYTEEEILSMLSDPNRELRKKAATSLTKGLKNSQQLLAYIFNMIKKDLSIECEIRGYKSKEEPRHIENQISQKSVDSLVKSVEAKFDLVQRFYNRKKILLGYEILYDYDRYAPINQDEEVYTYEKSCEIVLNSFNSFSPKFANIAKKAIHEEWIDVYPKKGKRSGAFSHSATPDSHPYVLLNHTNKRRDLFTLSHELGHAIHQYLSNQAGYINTNTPLTTAETASVFAEMLVFDHVKQSLDKQDKIAMLAGKIEDIFATLYRQINFTTFERAVHNFDGELSNKDFNALWMQESKKMFENSVVLTKEYETWWSYIPHFIHSPFYCYAYSYGQLLVLALYGLYKSGKCEDFVSKYEQFLASGGSKSPKDLVSVFDFDIDDVEFWKIGLNEVEKLVIEFEELVS